MDPTHRGFRDHLLEAERLSPPLKAKYEEEIKAMIEKPLSTPMKWVWAGSAVLGLSFAITFGTAALASPGELPTLARVCFAAGAVFGLVWMGLAISILRRGTINLKWHHPAAAGLAWSFTLLAMVCFIFLSAQMPDPIKGLHMLLSGLVFLIIAALFMIFNRIDQSQLKTQEKLLEIEYRIAKMAEDAKRRL